MSIITIVLLALGLRELASWYFRSSAAASGFSGKTDHDQDEEGRIGENESSNSEEGQENLKENIEQDQKEEEQDVVLKKLEVSGKDVIPVVCITSD